jgi:hypothetical protein
MIEFKDSPFWNNYLKGGDDSSAPIAAFTGHVEICGTYFASLPEGKSTSRYAPEKWSVKQVVGHITDANLIFLYRMVAIGRGETKALPGFDDNVYMANAPFDSLAWRTVLDNYRAVAQAAIGLLSGFEAAAWEREGCANDVRITPNQLLRVWMGHERHHIRTLKDRYGLA